MGCFYFILERNSIQFQLANRSGVCQLKAVMTTTGKRDIQSAVCSNTGRGGGNLVPQTFFSESPPPFFETEHKIELLSLCLLFDFRIG